MKNVSRLGGIRWVALLAAFTFLGCAVVVPLWTSRVYAATGSMYLTGTSSVAHGGTVTLNLRINPGTPVTVTQSSITYDASKLQFISINTSGSAFDTNVTQSQSSGSIQIDRAKLDPAGVSTDSLIASISFTALPYSGSTAVNLVPPSNAAYNGSYTNPALSGASISFTPGSCPAGQTGTPPSCTTPPASGGGTTSGGSSSTKPSNSGSNSSPSTPSSPTSTPAQTTPEAVSTLSAPSIVSTDFQYTVAGIVAKTNQAAQVQVKYGLSADSLNFQTPLTASGTSHTITITDNLPMATTIYYQLVATDGKVTQATKTQTVKTKGVVVTVLLLDKNRNPISGQTASIDDQEAKSSKDGYVTFNNLAPGEHQVVLKDGGKKRKQPFVILANITTTAGRQSTPDQNIFVVYDDYVPVGLIGVLPYVGGGLVLLTVVGAGVMYWRRNGGFLKHKTTTVPIEGLIVGGQGLPSKTPFDESAYNPFEPHDSLSGPGK
ncbi:MAG TPA: cohesin domain-containing protein [Candidatus Saccharimonadales bacterium]